MLQRDMTTNIVDALISVVVNVYVMIMHTSKSRLPKIARVMLKARGYVALRILAVSDLI